MKPSKYKAVRTTVDGVTFASKAEAKRDAELILLQRAGSIRHLTRQPRFPLVVNGHKIATYVGDWQYFCATLDEWVVEDKKGMQTPLFKCKWKLVKALNPAIDFRLS